MTETPEPAPETTESPDAEIEEELTVEDVDSTDAGVDTYYEEQSRAPRVMARLRIATDADSWTAEGADTTGLVDEDLPTWNVPYVSRPGVEILARQLPFPYTFRLPDFRVMDGMAGDWLIRDSETGHVFAITDRAFAQLFEPVTPPEPDAPTEAPSA